MSAVASRSRARRCAASAWATSSSPRPSRTSGTSRASRAGSATCSTSRRRASRRSSTSPRTSSRGSTTSAGTRTSPQLEGDIRAEIGDVEKRARARAPQARRGVRGRARGARGAATRKKNELERAEKARNKDFEDIRARADAEIEFLKTVWDTFKGLSPKQLVDDERVWRELAGPLRGVLRRRHGRRGHQGPHLPHRHGGRGGSSSRRPSPPPRASARPRRSSGSR